MLPTIANRPKTESPINVEAVRKLYLRDTTKGVSNRRLLKCTIPTGVYNAFSRMLEESGGSIAKGNGIGSPMVAVALKMMMAVMIKHRMNDTVDDIRSIVNDQSGREEIANNMQALARRIEQR